MLKGAYSKQECVGVKEKGMKKEREGTSMINDGVAKLVVAHSYSVYVIRERLHEWVLKE